MQPTKKQVKFIADIEEFVPEKFTGTTKKEASEYIDRNIEMYKLNFEDSYVLTRGYF